MSIEQLLKENTEILKEVLAELKQFKLNAPAIQEVTESETNSREENVELILDTYALSPLDYQTVKDEIDRMAKLHREDIKKLHAKYGITIFPDILNDRKDISKGVKDQKMLEDYYKDLLLLKN